MPAILILALVGLLLLAWACAPRGVPWVHRLVRLNAGAAQRGEWMAPTEVVRAVKRDYMAALGWLAECSADWGLIAREAERYTAGAFLRREQSVVGALVHTRGPRLALTLTAEHDLAVRRFTSDGLRCLLIDRQSHVAAWTRRYWSGKPTLQQRLPDTTLVVQMAYDPHDRRWKIEQVIQALPHATRTGVALTLSPKLPAAAGRDY